MNDGVPGIEPCPDPVSPDDGTGTGPFAHARRAPPDASASDSRLGELAEWLPRLGSVLWLERCHRASIRATCAQAVPAMLLDHPALAILLASRHLRAHQAITAHGPREWLGFVSASGAVGAKLFLLPDSNVLAWDEMISALQIAPGETEHHGPPTHCSFVRRALSRLGQNWQARLLEFRCLRQPWLSVLDARPPLRISLLGLDIAGGIVRDENAEWISPLHMC